MSHLAASLTHPPFPLDPPCSDADAPPLHGPALLQRLRWLEETSVSERFPPGTRIWVKVRRACCVWPACCPRWPAGWVTGSGGNVSGAPCPCPTPRPRPPPLADCGQRQLAGRGLVLCPVQAP